MHNIKITKRGLQITLGLFWLLDGVLQLQHQMFSSNFANQVISPSASGQPLLISGPIHFGVHLILMHPAVYDSFFAIIQLLIAGAILNRKTVKFGLIGSILWGVAVWFGGEGMAGILSGHTTLVIGAPGAAIIYALIALAIMPSKKRNNYPAYWLAFVWSAIWIGGAIFQLLPGQDSVAYLKTTILSMSYGTPGWLFTIDNQVVRFLSLISKQPLHIATHTTETIYMMGMQMKASQVYISSSKGYWFILLLALIELFVGVGVFLKGRTRKIVVIFGMVLSLIFWIIGQNLGNYYTGLATDPNTGPILILLGLIILSLKQLDQELSVLFKRLENVIIGSSRK
jgi:hypothetical protein